MGVSVFCFRTFTVHLQNWRTGHVRRFIFGISSIFLLLGVAAHLSLSRLAALQFSPRIVAIVLIVVTILLLERPMELLPWAVVYPYLVHSVHNSSKVEFRWLLANSLVIAVGRASYSVYLLHLIILYLSIWILTNLLDHPRYLRRIFGFNRINYPSHRAKPVDLSCCGVARY
jgi:peptidoglycan/LPS O-acetylase OafA/YrhL